MTETAPEYGALCAAAKRGDADGVRMLLEQGADPNEKDSYETPALVYAASRSFEVVKMLVTAGADVNVQTKGGRSPLECCILGGVAINGTPDKIAMLHFLIDKGASLDKTEPQGMPILLWARTMGNAEAVEVIKETLTQRAAQAKLSERSKATLATQEALKKRRPKVNFL